MLAKASPSHSAASRRNKLMALSCFGASLESDKCAQ